MIKYFKKIVALLSALAIIMTVVPATNTPVSAAIDSSTAAAIQAEPWSVTSPDGKIKISITQAADGSLSYVATKGTTTVIESSALGIDTGLADFKTGLVYTDSATKTINESYTMIVAKKSTYVNNCNGLTLKFTKNGKQMNVVLRAYNDGIAYRYELPTSTSVSSEYSQFNLPNGNIWIEDRQVSDEGNYNSKAISAASSAGINYSTGAAAKLDNGNYLWLGEAAVYGDYSTSSLKGSGATDGVFNVVNVSGVATSSGTNKSPWRLAIIGGLNTLFETTIIENLNPANEIGDTSWIKTGGTAWEWMNGDSTTSLDVAKKYIDFAASMGWKYYIADEGWSDSWAPEMITYGNSKGVGVILWAHHNNLNTQAEVDTLLTKWAAWGAKGIKVDFFDGERQLENQERDRVAIKAAELKLVVDFHGILKPSGQNRRWPNIIAWEGIKGGESYPNATQTNTTPYTRGVAGITDFTPVNTFNGGTPGYETALALTYSNGIICYVSKPEQYQGYLTKEFIKVLPASFDETKFVEGSIGNYLSIARRKGNDWYIGGTTAVARTASVPLSFLGSGTYVATIYRDKTYSTELVTNNTTLNLATVARGGFVVYISSKSLPDPVTGKVIDLADITASSSETGNAPINAFDGNANTRWTASDGTYPQWWKIDLGSVKAVEGMKIKWFESASRYYKYKIETSADNVNFTTVVDKTSNSVFGDTTDSFFAQTRYIRVTVTGTVGSGWASAYDFEVQFPKITASSSEEGNGPNNAIDGNANTRWAASSVAYPQWLEMNLGSVKEIKGLDIKWYNSASRAYKYKIETSTDNVHFTTVVDKTSNSVFGDTSNSFSANARYIRITITGCSESGGWVSINEVNVK